MEIVFNRIIKTLFFIFLIYFIIQLTWLIGFYNKEIEGYYVVIEIPLDDATARNEVPDYEERELYFKKYKKINVYEGNLFVFLFEVKRVEMKDIQYKKIKN